MSNELLDNMMTAFLAQTDYAMHCQLKYQNSNEGQPWFINSWIGASFDDSDANQEMVQSLEKAWNYEWWRRWRFDFGNGDVTPQTDDHLDHVIVSRK